MTLAQRFEVKTHDCLCVWRQEVGGGEVMEQHVQRPHDWRRCGVFLELEAAQ